MYVKRISFCMIMKLDDYDFRILDMLATNSKRTISELSSACGLSRTPVYERIKKLEEAKVIEGYSADINHASVGLAIHAFCSVSLKEHSTTFLTTFEREILTHSEVVNCHHIAGNFDYLIEIRCADMDAYHDLISIKLAGIENIGNVQSSFVLKPVKAKTTPKLSINS